MMNNQSGILLESGTNELEVLEFTIAGNGFGINVAKVRELMKYQTPQPMAKAHPDIEGIFKPRNEVYPVIDLAGYLGLPDEEDKERHIFIIAGFNKVNVAFHVHSVESIHRISWENIEKPDTIIYGGEEGVATGIAKIEDRIISIIDFEKIVFDISPELSINVEEVEELEENERGELPVLLAEDSMLLRKLLVEALNRAGYNELIVCSNGQEAWNRMVSIKQTGNVYDNVRAVITDIEMPQMDGHTLTKNIKDDAVLQKLPVIIFSSLIDDTLRHKGEEVGASAQLSKPEIGNLVATLDKLIIRDPSELE